MFRMDIGCRQVRQGEWDKVTIYVQLLEDAMDEGCEVGSSID